jgi:hypothetical protein
VSRASKQVKPSKQVKEIGRRDGRLYVGFYWLYLLYLCGGLCACAGQNRWLRRARTVGEGAQELLPFASVECVMSSPHTLVA